MTDEAVPTLYEWAGGTQAFERLTEVFYRSVVKDDLVGPLFAHMDPDHPKYVAMWLSEVFGGPTGTPPNAAATPTCSATTSASRSPSRSAADG